MSTLALSPRFVPNIDREWGHSVVSLVNSMLSLEMDYTSPTSPCQLPDPQVTVSAPRELPLFREELSDSDLFPAHKTSFTDVPVSPSPDGTTMSPDVSSLCNRDTHGRGATTSQRPIPVEKMTARDGYVCQQPSAYALRVPDFFKRVFAPPNCLTPEISSPLKRGSPHLDSLADREREQNAILGQAIFRSFPRNTKERVTTHRYNTVPKIAQMKSRHKLPWTPAHPTGKPGGTCNTRAMGLRNLEHWREEQALWTNIPISGDQDFPHDILYQDKDEALLSPRVAGTADFFCSESHYSTDEDLTGESHLREVEHRTSDLGLSMICEKTLTRASDREAQIERDIQAFLDFAPSPSFLAATTVGEVCEDVVTSVGARRQMQHSLGSESIDAHPVASFRNSRNINAFHFFPRQTIGKLKRAGNRRTLSIDSH